MNRINKRVYFVLFILILSFILLIYKLTDIQVINHDYYLDKLNDLKITTIKSNSTPRGRIYDRNHNLLVDNVGVKTIYYKRKKGTTSLDQVKLIKKIKDKIDINYDSVSDINLKEYYYVLNKDIVDSKITKEENDKYEKRKLSSEDIYNLKMSRISEEELSSIDKKEAYIYYLMNKGYYYNENIIKTYATEEEYAFVASNIKELKGFNVKLEWERKYLYGDTFKSILGSVSSSSSGIPKELKDYYLSKGYSLNDKVGISFIEYQYEDLLKGEKAIYKLNDDNSYSLIKDGKRGNDIVLSIDINMQREVERILEEEIINAKVNDLNTSLYDGSSVIVTDPFTGEILAFSSKYIVNKDGEYKIYDNSPALLTNPVTPGSIVKGASISVGYKYGAIDIGTKIYDECVKIQNTPKKCSWISGIGLINDVEALAISSNAYQYKTAMKVAGASYYYDGPLYVDKSAFDKYRSMFNEYGLGVKTGIDLPIESIGVIGNKYDSGLLLDFAIGQYDTYTPVQISSYISTIASYGNRYRLHFLKEIRNSSLDDEIGSLREEIKPVLLKKVDLEDKYINRIREGFKRVMNVTGYGYMGDVPDSSGKTGTAETFKDTDGDGNIDKETISRAFVGFAPSDNPKFTITILSPNVKYSDTSDYSSPVNFKISERVSNKVFEFFK
ncbi:MAG: penicillin-binding protein 2 [Bacilli bacterium]|nr:penicillin-binding protein 2 [Bacilli bacterium]